MKFNRIYIEITNICGLQCDFCPTSAVNNKIMQLDFFENIVEQASYFTNEIVCHVMGDPLVLSNIGDYLDIIKKYNMKAMLTTSGFYMQKHIPKVLLHPCVRQLNISLNSFNKNSPKITLEEYLNPILELCNAKIEHYNEPFLNLRLWNMDNDNSEAEFNDLILASLEQFFGIKIKKNSDKKGFRLASKIILHFDDYFQWPSLSNQIYGDGYCGGLSSHIAILNDGIVVPCCLDYEGVINLGDLKNEKLKDILESQKSKSIRDGFKNKIATEELCQKCSYKNRFDEL
jgi:radical SAM protein with 4Fe4S-binding SPASM domain